jgi:hypothetical protein
MEGRLQHTGALDCGTDDQRARNDDDDVVTEPGEGFLVRHDASEHGGQEGQDGDEIVAQPSPDEQGHHSGQDGESEGLILRHRSARDGEVGRDNA